MTNEDLDPKVACVFQDIIKHHLKMHDVLYRRLVLFHCMNHQHTHNFHVEDYP